MKANFTVSAACFKRGIGLQWQVRNDFSKKDPGPPAFRENIGIFAVPAQPGALSYRAIYHAPGINKQAGLYIIANFFTRIFTQPGGKLLKPRFDDFVIVVTPCIT